MSTTSRSSGIRLARRPVGASAAWLLAVVLAAFAGAVGPPAPQANAAVHAARDVPQTQHADTPHIDRSTRSN